MRSVRMVLLSGAALWAHPALAADSLKFGPAPAWVHLQSIPTAKPTDAPVAMLLSDQQLALDGPKISSYTELAFKIQNPQGLAAGNLSFIWDPSTDTVTVNKLHIIRGDKVIDVLASGQTFTVVRRETNLDAAVLDGTLTANIQPEGLQEGDIIDLATTDEHSDPILKGHVEASFGEWNGIPLQAAHVLVSWPQNAKIDLRESLLPPLQRSVRNGRSIAEAAAVAIEPIISPKGAPNRFTVGRRGEATDFSSWSAVAALMLPLYLDASVIPATGSLRDEVEKIRNVSSDSKMRAQLALALVQDRVRYVALVMGQGGFVPASAEQTWSRRFGDCKAKSTLLLALLRELGIPAEAVLVNTTAGDAIADRLPMLGLFDHVLVRAHIEGKDYWLDGTRTDDADIDSIQIPDFGWGLPLIDHTALVHLLPLPLSVPENETQLEIDASKGIYASAPAHAEQILHGDLAVALQSPLSSMSEAQRQSFFQTYWNKTYDFITFKNGSARFNKAKRELHLLMTGDAKMDWTGGYFHVPNSSIGYDPDFNRPPGPSHDAPVQVDYPSYSKTVTTLHMPPSFLGGRNFTPIDDHETIAGIEYKRTAKLDGDVVTVETSARSVLPEISYKDALAAQARLKKLADEDVSLPLTSRYRSTAADLEAMKKDQPTTATEFVDRGNNFMNAWKLDEAVADFTTALKLDPKDVTALADRSLAYIWKNQMNLADKDLAAAQAIAPDNAIVDRGRALLAERKGNCRAAIVSYSKSLTEESSNSFALGHRAICEREVGMDSEALADSEGALRDDSDWGELHFIRADIFVRRGDSAAASAEMKHLSGNETEGSLAQGRLGKLYARLGMRQRAFDAFTQALAAKDSADLYLARAQVRPLTDSQGRMADIDAALKLDLHNSNAVIAKADLLASQGDLVRALEVYDQASRVITGLSPLSVGRAIILYKLGRKAEAQKLLSAWRKSSGTASEFTKLCSSEAIAGILLNSAVDDCESALHINKDYVAAIESLALAKLRLGEYDEAASLYDQSIAKGDGAISYMGRAIAYARKGDLERAQIDRATALRFDPDAEKRFTEYGLNFAERAPATATAEDRAPPEKP